MSNVTEMQSELAAKRAVLEEMKERRRALEANRDAQAFDLARAQTARGEALLDGDEDRSLRALADLSFAKQSGEDTALQLRVLNARLLTLAGEIADLDVAWRREDHALANAEMAALSHLNTRDARSELWHERENQALRQTQADQQAAYVKARARVNETLDTLRYRSEPREYLIEQLLMD